MGPCNRVAARLRVLVGAQSVALSYRLVQCLDVQVVQADVRRWAFHLSVPLSEKLYNVFELVVGASQSRTAVARLGLLKVVSLLCRDCLRLAPLCLRITTAQRTPFEKLHHRSLEQVWQQLGALYAKGQRLLAARRAVVFLPPVPILIGGADESDSVDWETWHWPYLPELAFLHYSPVAVVSPDPAVGPSSSSPLTQEVITLMQSPPPLAAALTQPASYASSSNDSPICSPTRLSVGQQPMEFAPLAFGDALDCVPDTPVVKRARFTPSLVHPIGYGSEAYVDDSVPSSAVADPLGSGVAERVADLLRTDQSRLALRPTSFSLLDVCRRLYNPTNATNRRTSKGQKSAWKHWTAWCQLHNTEPWRLERHTTDVDHHRESVLQAGFLRFVHVRQSARPRNGRKAALPSSAAKTLSHIRKMHKDRDFPMTPSHLVQVEIRRLLTHYKTEYGCSDLIPKQKQPFTRDILLNTILGTPDGYELGNYRMSWASRKGRSVAALTKTLANTGFRKAEVSVDKHGDHCTSDCLSRASLTWQLRGKLYTTTTVPHELLRSPQPGDFAILTPPPSKSDPYDMVWGNKPIWLPYLPDALAAFTALADIELNDGLTGPPHSVALFTDNDAQAFSGAQLDRLLRAMLLRHYPEHVAKNYSWHSARIFVHCHCPPCVEGLSSTNSSSL